MLSSVKYFPYLLKQCYNIWQFEKWDPKKIECYQIKALNKILDKARSIPFYRELYQKAGVLDLKIKSLDDLVKLPTIDKSLCRETGYEAYSDKTSNSSTMITATSGSTGVPFQIRIPRKIEMVPPLKVIYLMRQFGWNPFLKGLEIWREDSSTHKNFMRKTGLLKSISIFKPLEEIKAKIEQEKPDYLFCTRSFYMVLVDYLEKTGYHYKPKYLLSTTEEVSSVHRKRLESFFQALLINVYGCMESPTIAYSCPECKNLHVFQTTVIVEIINKRFIEGEEFGDIAISNLTNDIMPFIRYRTGDVVRVKSSKCKCHRNSQIIGDILGRNDDVIITRDGIVFNFHHFYSVFRSLYYINQYQVVYHKENDKVEFIFAMSKPYNQDNIIEMQNILSKNFSNIEYSMSIVDQIPLSSSGKFKIIELVDN